MHKGQCAPRKGNLYLEHDVAPLSTVRWPAIPRRVGAAHAHKGALPSTVRLKAPAPVRMYLGVLVMIGVSCRLRVLTSRYRTPMGNMRVTIWARACLEITVIHSGAITEYPCCSMQVVQGWLFGCDSRVRHPRYSANAWAGRTGGYGRSQGPMPPAHRQRVRGAFTRACVWRAQGSAHRTVGIF